MKNCCVIGLGYIGLPTAALASSAGFKVLGVDINKKVLDCINSGLLHIDEPYLTEFVSESIKKGNLEISNVPDYSEIFIIAVPTPIYYVDSIPKADLKYVFKAIDSILNLLKRNSIVIIESTCPIGTTEEIRNHIQDFTNLRKDEIHLAYCPERVLPGQIIKELKSNNRIIGCSNKYYGNKIKKFYKSFCNGEIILTETKTAELVKLAENSFRDVNIAFANELSIISDNLGIDINELIKLANLHPRVNILKPGCGVGGHCIPIDPWFLISNFPNDSKLIKKAREVNEEKINWVSEKIEKHIKANRNKYPKKIKIGIFGLSFKPNVNDLRESPSIKIISRLNENYNLLICEPNIENHPEFFLTDIEYTKKHSDLLVFLVAHDQFKDIDLSKVDFLDFCFLND